ncbi:hypothetical protein A11Q_80 [Pseudobdellovibrio exovorus JSS]|uniref:RDD domain-containing protein n=2 Tax=Pseudobdellovibrio exovorus TaxID=453816 RepID=M4V785_9BACT|nr:hypothetical protein A11Q_80 [Pseudobdellovibrio exovorus JSS]
MDFMVSVIAAYTIAVFLPVSANIGIEKFIILFYFIITQALFGFTLGKKLMGLRVVRLGDDQKASWPQIIGRELIGKPLSALVLFFGFLCIFINKERLGLHDKIFRTQVISDEPKELVSLFQVFTHALAAILVSTAVVYFVGLYTSIPLKGWANRLQDEGVNIEGIRGNLKQGFAFKKVQFSNEDIGFEGENLVFKYDNILDLFQGKNFHIKQISASKIELTSFKAEDFQSRKKRPAATVGGKPKTKSAKRSSSAAKMSLFCDLIDISEIKITLSDKQVYEAKKLHVKNTQMVKSDINIQKIYLDSEDLFVDIEDFSYVDATEVVSVLSSSVVVKKTMYPQYLSGDVDFKMKGSINLKSNKMMGSITAFRNSFQLSSLNGEDVDLRTVNFHPQWYFKNIPPIHSFNVEYSGRADGMPSTPFTGYYKLGIHHVNLDRKTEVGKLFIGQLSLGSGMIVGLSFQGRRHPERPLLVHLNSFENQDATDVVAKILFWKPREELTEADRAKIAQNSNYFLYKKLETSFDTLPPFDQRMQQELQQRAPANNQW